MPAFEAVFTRLSREDAVLSGWEGFVAGRDTYKSKHNGKIAEDELVLRMGCSAVSEVAFRQYIPDTNVRWIDESNRGEDSLANGAGSIALDGISPNPRAMGGGYAFQLKAVESEDKTEIVLTAGNFPTIAALLGNYRGHLSAHRVKIPIALTRVSMPPVGGNPKSMKLMSFAVIELTALVRQTTAWSGVEYPDYDWDVDALIHVRNPLKKGRSGAAKAPLRVTWGKGNGGKQTYARLVLSLAHPSVRGALRWVDTSDMTDAEAAACLHGHIVEVAKRG